MLAGTLLSNACSSPVSLGPVPSARRFTATPWPEADALFHRDPRWLGADGAWTIDLGDERILWLFADTIIDMGGEPSRRSETVDMVSNSLAIQAGADPSSADIDFFWNTAADGSPAAFFPDSDGVRHWPGHAVRIEQTLLIFLMHVQASDLGLGFEVFDWSVVAIDNPDDSPAAWRTRSVETPKNSDRIIIGSTGVLVHDDFLYAFGSREREEGRGRIHLARWPIADAARADLRNMQWWSARGRWVADDHAAKEASPVFEHLGTECSVHFDAELRQFLNVHTVGFGDADLMLRSAPTLPGPWSDDDLLYRPEEADWPGVMVYSGKAHPALEGADLVATYCSNAFDFTDLLSDDRIYYPRFVRLTLPPSSRP